MSTKLGLRYSGRIFCERETNFKKETLPYLQYLTREKVPGEGRGCMVEWLDKGTCITILPPSMPTALSKPLITYGNILASIAYN